MSNPLQPHESQHARPPCPSPRVPDCDSAGMAKRSYPRSEVGGAAERRYPASEVRGGGQEEMPHSPKPKAGGGSREEQPHVQGAMAAWAQEGLEELSHVEGQEGGSEEIPLVQGKEQWLRFAGAAMKRYPTPKVRETQVRW